MFNTKALEKLRDRWLACWPRALACWSRYTKLKDPIWCFNRAQAKQEGLTSSFAMIRLDDHSVVIGLDQIAEMKLDDYGLEILAHEIGHHILIPGDLNDHGRMIARMRRALSPKEVHAPMVANLYGDLLINDRLQRSEKLRISDVYKVMCSKPGDALWTFYMRAYEILWSMKKGSLALGPISDRLEGDAMLCARLIRVYAGDWMRGAGKFAALVLPYLLESDAEKARQMMKDWADIENAAGNAIPDGLTEDENIEEGDLQHPIEDPALSGESGEGGFEHDSNDPFQGTETSLKQSRGQHREPFEYGQILKALGLKLDDHEIAVRYYRERASRQLIAYPQRILPESSDPLPEGTEPWDIGMPLEDIDWMQSVLSSPHVIPGMTTLQRVIGKTQGSPPEREPLDLDLYVDCSGSMPNPQAMTSFLTLAGAIVAMSALRTGARVQATLWSGVKQFLWTDGFVRDENKILRVLTGYFGGGTAFPIHILRDTFEKRTRLDRAAHILIISDDGVTTLFDKDEKGNSGWDVSRMALKNARGGGTMVLNLYQDWKNNPALQKASKDGWSIHGVSTWEQLTAFARAFSRAKYGEVEAVQA